MKKFFVLEKAGDNEIKTVHPFLSSLWGINKLITPFIKDEHILMDTVGSLIKIPDGFESIKLSYLKNTIGKKNIILSKDYDINFNNDFYLSCIVRAFDIFSLRMGSDLRTNEVLIADADNFQGRMCFYFLLPIARRIILLTERKQLLQKEVEYAYNFYGTSVAVLEDIVNAEKLCDSIVITDNRYEFLMGSRKPTLILCKANNYTSMSFDSVELTIDFEDFFQPIFALGYLDVNELKKIWPVAEEQGFRIGRFLINNQTIFEL